MFHEKVFSSLLVSSLLSVSSSSLSSVEMVVDQDERVASLDKKHFSDAFNSCKYSAWT